MTAVVGFSTGSTQHLYPPQIPQALRGLLGVWFTTARTCCGTLTCSGPSRRQAGFRGPEASLSSTGWYDTWHLQIAQGPVKGCASVLDQGFEAQQRVPAFPGASEPPRNSAYVTDPNLHEFRFHPPVFVLGSS